MQNNYWLIGTGSTYGIGGIGNGGATPKTSEEMKQLDNILGSEFTNDSININNGYPILKWQLEE